MATSTIAKFSALVLWLLFTTVIALRDSNEFNKQDVETSIPNGLSLGTNAEVDKQEFFDGVPTAAALSNKGIQGRKMLVNDVVMRKENMAVMKARSGVLMKDGSSLKSGKLMNDASKMSVNVAASSSQNNMKNQNDNKMLMKAKKLNSASMKNVHTPDGFINNLMHKDYNGNNGLKPRRKPPINNYQPMDDYHNPHPHPPVIPTNAQTNDDYYAPPARQHPPSNPSTTTYEPMTVDYSTPNLNYEPFNNDYPKGSKASNQQP